MRIGIDLGGTKIEGIVIDGAREIARLRVPTPRDDYAATIDAIASVVDRLEDSAGDRGSVGIGIPGTLVPSTGLVKNANSVWLIGKPLLRDLETRLGREVRIANDANCFAMSEAADGAASGDAVVFGVIVGTGTGAGVVVRGEILTGANGIAGEWGHNPLPWPEDDERPGRDCYCGKRGCIETFLSGPGMTNDHERRTGRREMPEEIVRAADRGDRAATITVQHYEHRMARALASVINVLDPDAIVLGGGMSNIERLYENVPRLWSEYVFAATMKSSGVGASDVESVAAGPMAGANYFVHTRLVRAKHGDASGVRGAAWLWPGPDRG